MHMESTEADNIRAKAPLIYKAIETGNTAGIDTLFAENFIEHNAPDGREIKGRDSLMAMFRTMHNQFRDLKFNLISNAYDNGYLLTMVRVTGITTQSGMGMPADTKFDTHNIDVVRFVNGKAVEHWEYDRPQDVMKWMETAQQNKQTK